MGSLSQHGLSQHNNTTFFFPREKKNVHSELTENKLGIGAKDY